MLNQAPITPPCQLYRLGCCCQACACMQPSSPACKAPFVAQADASNASSWIKTTLMLEEYLDGPEVDVDLIISEGEAVYGAITDNWPTVEPYFNETGSNCPSILPASHQRELMDLAVASVHSLGLQMVRLLAKGQPPFMRMPSQLVACLVHTGGCRTHQRPLHAAQGVFHVELKYTTHGPRLIEVNCRMGGGPVRATNLLVWGVDLVEEQLLCSAGIPSRPPIAAKPLMYIAEYSVNAKVSGRVMNTEFCKVGFFACAASTRRCGDVFRYQLIRCCAPAGVGEPPRRAVRPAACKQGPEGDCRDGWHADLGGGGDGQEAQR